MGEMMRAGGAAYAERGTRSTMTSERQVRRRRVQRRGGYEQLGCDEDEPEPWTWQHVVLGVLGVMFAVVLYGAYLIELEADEAALQKQKLASANEMSHEAVQRKQAELRARMLEDAKMIDLHKLPQEKQDMLRPLDIDKNGEITMNEAKRMMYKKFGIHSSQMTYDTLTQLLDLLEEEAERKKNPKPVLTEGRVYLGDDPGFHRGFDTETGFDAHANDNQHHHAQVPISPDHYGNPPRVLGGM